MLQVECSTALIKHQHHITWLRIACQQLSTDELT